MKKLLLFLAVCAIAASCSKKDNPARAKAVMIKKRSHTQGKDSWAIEYSFSADGVATQSRTTGSLGNYTLTFQRNATGAITRYDYSDGATGYATVEYDASGRISKVRQYTAAGTENGYITYEYFQGYHEIKRYNATVGYTARDDYYYTADGKNVASKKSYNSSGTQTWEMTFTYSDKPGPSSLYPEKQMQQIGTGYASENALVSESVSNFSTPGGNYGRTLTNIHNTNGYLTQAQSVYTNNLPTLTSIYEYVTR